MNDEEEIANNNKRKISDANNVTDDDIEKKENNSTLLETTEGIVSSKEREVFVPMNLAGNTGFSNDAPKLECDHKQTDDPKEQCARLEKNRQKARDRRTRKKMIVEEMQQNVLVLSRMNSKLRQKNQDLLTLLTDHGFTPVNLNGFHNITAGFGADKKPTIEMSAHSLQAAGTVPIDLQRQQKNICENEISSNTPQQQSLRIFGQNPMLTMPGNMV